MGDRCTVVVVCAKQHEGEVTAIMNGCVEPEYGANGTEYTDVLELEFEEMNYGGYDELHAIAEKHIPFFGWHGSGSSYCAGVFSAHGGEFGASPTTGDENSPSVGVDRHGDVFAGQMECAMKYWKLRILAEKAMAPVKRRNGKRRKLPLRKSQRIKCKN